MNQPLLRNLFFISLLLATISSASIVIPEFLNTKNESNLISTKTSYTDCCYRDKCSGGQICANSYGRLTDGCNRTYKVYPECRIRSVRCCQKDECNSDETKCFKLILSQKPKNLLEKNDIFCDGTKAILKGRKTDQCIDNNPIKPIDIIAKGTSDEIERILKRDYPDIPFQFEHTTNESSTVSSRLYSPLNDMLRMSGESISASGQDTEFDGCKTSSTGECTIQVTIKVENSVNESISTLENHVSDATSEIENEIEFLNLFNSSKTTSRQLVITSRRFYCAAYRSAYFCLTYHCDLV